MKGLLLKLSALDADAESAVRVIGFFDTLVERKATLETLLRSAAALAECPVGLHAPEQGIALRADPGGELRTSVQPPHAAVHRLGRAIFWLERPGSTMPLDEIVLERFALAGEILLGNALPELGDPALVELVLADSAGEAERSRALHLLELTPTTTVRVLAVDAKPEVATTLGHRAAPLGRLHAVLVPETTPVAPVADARIGVGPVTAAMEAAHSWRAARTALRFTGAGGLTRFEQLGGLSVLAERLSAEDLADIDDLTALDRLAAGPETLEILQAFCTTGSARKTATAVYRHHSTVAARLARAESVLGFTLDTPDGRFRLNLALLLRQLRDSPGQSHH